MAISVIKQDYIVKSVVFITFLCILSLSLIGGCSDSGGGNDSQVLTENDFANDPSLQVDPDKQIIVDFLESPDSDTPQNDTGPVGIDEILITYPQTETRTFCWEDDNSEAMDYMVLFDSQEEEVLRVDVNGDCVTDTIESGDYVMELHHDQSMGDPRPIFIIPDLDQNQQAMKTDGLFNGFKVVVAKILTGIQNTISKNARAQTVQQNITTLLRTNSCVECDLRDAIMGGANFSGADLRGADLSGARLAVCNLTGADLSGADLRGADLQFAVLEDAILRGADLRKAVLWYAQFFFADLTGANLISADLRYADFQKATWCNGSCECKFPSQGTCNGCPPVEEVCTGS